MTTQNLRRQIVRSRANIVILEVHHHRTGNLVVDHQRTSTAECFGENPAIVTVFLFAAFDWLAASAADWTIYKRESASTWLADQLPVRQYCPTDRAPDRIQKRKKNLFDLLQPPAGRIHCSGLRLWEMMNHITPFRCCQSHLGRHCQGMWSPRSRFSADAS